MAACLHLLSSQSRPMRSSSRQSHGKSKSHCRRQGCWLRAALMSAAFASLSLRRNWISNSNTCNSKMSCSRKRSACWRSPRSTAVVQATQMNRCNQTHSLSTAPAPLMGGEGPPIRSHVNRMSANLMPPECGGLPGTIGFHHNVAKERTK